MLAEFKKFIEKEKIFFPGDRILLAVSGGMDSVAMTELFRLAGFTFGIAHCNFSLRSKESDGDEVFVRNLACKHKVPFYSEHFDAKSYAVDQGISVQMAARELRYTWFEELRRNEGYACIATAHHRDDQVETFLFNLGRGTGIAGLHGILPKNGYLIRPMLFATRMKINDFILKNNIYFREDSSNSLIKYHRNRIRHKIIPEMERLNPGFREEILSTIMKIRDVEEIYREAIRVKSEMLIKKKGEETIISIEEIRLLSPLGTWVFELLQPYGFTGATVDALLPALTREPGKFFHSPTHRLLIDRENLVIVPMITRQEIENKSDRIILETLQGAIRVPVPLQWSGCPLIPEVFAVDPVNAYFDLHCLKFPLEIRRWTRGDYFFPLGMKKKKKLSDFFIDNKLSRIEKERTWLLCSGDDIVWIIGHRIDDRFKVTSATKRVLKMRVIDSR